MSVYMYHHGNGCNHMSLNMYQHGNGYNHMSMYHHGNGYNHMSLNMYLHGNGYYHLNASCELVYWWHSQDTSSKVFQSIFRALQSKLRQSMM